MAEIKLGPQHADVLANLWELHEEGTFADFTIHLEDGSVRTCKFLVASLSTFFKILVTGDMLEGMTGEVHLKHITRNTWSCIEAFYFKGERQVTDNNVEVVLAVSHMYGLNKLAEHCCEVLQSQCKADNCLAVRRIAERLDLENVRRRANQVLCDNFLAVSKLKEFLLLKEEEIFELLEEELVTTEEELCKALMCWTKSNGAYGAWAGLFQHICLQRVSDDYFFDLIFKYGSSPVGAVMKTALKEEASRRHVSQSSVPLEVIPRRRRSPSANTNMFILGHNMEGRFIIFLWSAFEQRWINYPGPQQVVVEHFSAASVDDIVVITGGKGSKDTILFDWGKKCWMSGPDMQQKRCDHGMAVIRNKVYVVAGYVGTRLTCIEEYSRSSDQWTHVGNLIVSADECGVTALDDIIFVVGGSTEGSASLIQSFNVETKTAAILNIRLPRPMHHVRATSFDGGAFFVGSEGDFLQIREVDGHLGMVSSVMLEGFHGEKNWFCLHARDDRVWVVGGNSADDIGCWNFKGKKVLNYWVDTLPEALSLYALLEVKDLAVGMRV